MPTSDPFNFAAGRDFSGKSGVWSCRGRLRTHPPIFRELLSNPLPPCLGAFHPLTMVSWQRWKILRVPEQRLTQKHYGWEKEKKKKKTEKGNKTLNCKGCVLFIFTAFCSQVFHLTNVTWWCMNCSHNFYKA